MQNSHKGRGQDWHRVPSMHQAQGGADQGVEGPLEGLVAHPWAAKGDASDISLRVLQRSPSRTCTCTNWSHSHATSLAVWARAFYGLYGHPEVGVLFGQPRKVRNDAFAVLIPKPEHWKSPTSRSEKVCREGKTCQSKLTSKSTTMQIVTTAHG